MNRVGFEPTQISLLAPEASALDRSAICPDDGFNERKAQLVIYISGYILGSAHRPANRQIYLWYVKKL